MDNTLEQLKELYKQDVKTLKELQMQYTVTEERLQVLTREIQKLKKANEATHLTISRMENKDAPWILNDRSHL